VWVFLLGDDGLDAIIPTKIHGENYGKDDEARNVEDLPGT
jgi:hypothetical protein